MNAYMKTKIDEMSNDELFEFEKEVIALAEERRNTAVAESKAGYIEIIGFYGKDKSAPLGCVLRKNNGNLGTITIESLHAGLNEMVLKVSESDTIFVDTILMCSGPPSNEKHFTDLTWRGKDEALNADLFIVAENAESVSTSASMHLLKKYRDYKKS